MIQRSVISSGWLRFSSVSSVAVDPRRVWDSLRDPRRRLSGLDRLSPRVSRPRGNSARAVIAQSVSRHPTSAAEALLPDFRRECGARLPRPRGPGWRAPVRRHDPLALPPQESAILPLADRPLWIVGPPGSGRRRRDPPSSDVVAPRATGFFRDRQGVRSGGDGGTTFGGVGRRFPDRSSA